MLTFNVRSFAFIYLTPANKFISIRILDEGPKLGEKCGDVGIVFHVCWNENETLQSVNNKSQLDFFPPWVRQNTSNSEK